MCLKALHIISIVLLTAIRIPHSQAVRGCVTYVAGADYSMKQSICDKPDTHFQVVPPALPSQVVKLTINHQEITRLNASQFKHLPNLTYLDLDSNKLSIIHPDTFQELYYLRTLSLRFNLLTLSVESFHPAAIRGLRQLEYLNLLHNPIGHVPNEFFAPIGDTLKTLVLAGSSGNFQLDTSSLNGLYNLQSLDLSSNHLETLPENLEMSLSSMQLKELYLYDNPWRCDCHLRWLKLWFLKQNTGLTFSRTILEGFSRRLPEVSPHTWTRQTYDSVDESTTVLQPKCASPYSLYGRTIFDQSDTGETNSLMSAEFHCSPRALTPSQSLHFVRGNNATMACEFFADPTGIVVWYRNGTKIQSSSPRIRIEQSQGRRFHTKLFIKETQSSDAGTYVCFLDTGYGRVNSTFLVHIFNEENSFASFISGSVFQWFSDLNTRDVLKYTGVTVSCLIIVLMLIGLSAYCFYGRCVRSLKKQATTSDSDKSNKLLIKDDLANSSKPEGNPLKVDVPTTVSHHTTLLRVPRSTLVRKSSIKGNQEILSAVNHLSGVQLVSTDEPSETNFVAFHIVPNGTNTNLKQKCVLHKYALIQSVTPSGLLLQDQVPAATSFSVKCEADVAAESHSLIPSLISSCDLSHQMVSSQLAGADLNHLVSQFPSQDTSKNPESQLESRKEGSYSPCPLHGDIYATLHNADQKSTYSKTNRLIATVPTGLESTFEKRTHTLPNRRKMQTCEKKPGEQTAMNHSTIFIPTTESNAITLETNIPPTVNSKSSAQ